MRIAAQIAFCFGMLLLLGAIWRLLPADSLTPDFVSLVAAYLGLSARDRLASSLAGAVGIGYLGDLLYGTPVGLMALTGGLVCTVCHLIQGRLLVRGLLVTMIFTGLTALLAGLFVLGVRASSGLLHLGIGHEVEALLQMTLVSGFLGPFVFRSCRAIDARFARTPRERDAAASGMTF